VRRRRPGRVPAPGPRPRPSSCARRHGGPDRRPGPDGNRLGIRDGAVRVTTRVGLLHPGAMGGAVGAALTSVGVPVAWASSGRSAASRARAERAGLTDVGTVRALAAESDLLVCICPPDAAVDVAGSVAGSGFAGTYVDANAVSPATARRIASIVEDGGGTFVDGDLIGGPPRPGGPTRLYLSG